MKKSTASLFIGTFVFLASFGAFFFHIYTTFVKTPASLDGKPLVYEVTSGQSFTQVAEDLQKIGVVKSSKFFNIYARVTGQRSELKTGDYEFRGDMFPSEVLAVLTSGRSRFRKFTVSEGLNTYEIAGLWEQAGLGSKEEFFKRTRDPELIRTLIGGEGVLSLEGYLFPETYQVTKFTTAAELIRQMVDLFKKEYQNVAQGLEAPRGMSVHEIVTFASLIEKESGVHFERPRIASVFFNRLKKDMKLQTDPTIIYGKAEETGIYELNITKADLAKATTYNTYVIQGLPPGPIANPGRKAIEAVFRPEETNYLFFVSQNDGTHIFSETYAEHAKAVEKFQMDPKAREGKSWRDLRNSADQEQN